MAICQFELNHRLKSEVESQGLPYGGTLWPGIQLLEAAGVSLGNSLLKKFNVGKLKSAEDAALAKFLAVNTSCRGWTLDRITTKQEIIIGTVRQVLYDFWHEGGYALTDNPLHVLEKSRVGPGANRMARAGSFYAKLFASPLSCSSLTLYHWYQRYASRFPLWKDAEETRASLYGEPHVVASSRLSFVPKNDKIARTTCTEPTLNTFFQLGLGSLLERRYDRFFGRTMRMQPFQNRAFARVGSITGHYATIDLSSASDSLSLGMLEHVLPSSFLRELLRYRVAATEVRGLGTVELNMVSTMGNGFTFPLQTVLFSAVVVAVLRFRDITWGEIRGPGLWGVFGDDIVCPTWAFNDVVEILALLGFSVNHDKTFCEGPFRESCGVDAFDGVNIRGVYVKKLDTTQDSCLVINQLNRFSARTGVSVEATCSWLLKNMRKPLFVPPYEDMSSGVHTPRPPNAKDRITGQWSYALWVPKVRSYKFGDDGVVSHPSGHKPLAYNPSGYMLAILQGSAKGSAMPVREKGPTTYYAKRKATSAWSCFARARQTSDEVWLLSDEPDWESDDYQLGWGRWESVTGYLVNSSRAEKL